MHSVPARASEPCLSRHARQPTRQLETRLFQATLCSVHRRRERSLSPRLSPRPSRRTRHLLTVAPLPRSRRRRSSPAIARRPSLPADRRPRFPWFRPCDASPRIEKQASVPCTTPPPPGPNISVQPRRFPPNSIFCRHHHPSADGLWWVVLSGCSVRRDPAHPAHRVTPGQKQHLFTNDTGSICFSHVSLNTSPTPHSIPGRSPPRPPLQQCPQTTTFRQVFRSSRPPRVYAVC